MPRVLFLRVRASSYHGEDRKKLQREMPGEAQGWKVVEVALKEALAKMEADWTSTAANLLLVRTQLST